MLIGQVILMTVNLLGYLLEKQETVICGACPFQLADCKGYRNVPITVRLHLAIFPSFGGLFFY